MGSICTRNKFYGAVCKPGGAENTLKTVLSIAVRGMLDIDPVKRDIRIININRVCPGRLHPIIISGGRNYPRLEIG
jgi:hypothetical protein